MRKKELGRKGECLAKEFLEQSGYTVLAMNYRSRYGEIDIIAEEGGDLVFIEVKTRSGDEFGTGLEAITASKRAHIIRAATEYLHEQQAVRRTCRFDAVEVDMDEDGRPAAIDVVKGAFMA